MNPEARLREALKQIKIAAEEDELPDDAVIGLLDARDGLDQAIVAIEQEAEA